MPGKSSLIAFLRSPIPGCVHPILKYRRRQAVFRTLAALKRRVNICVLHARARTLKGIQRNVPPELANRYHSQRALSSLVIIVK